MDLGLLIRLDSSRVTLHNVSDYWANRLRLLTLNLTLTLNPNLSPLVR